MAIDIIDEKLLEVLQENARISISELSKRINLSLSAVSDRLKKLENSGIIKQYTAILEPETMNKNMAAMVLLNIENLSTSQDFHKYVEENRDIISCTRIAGNYDFVLEIYTKDQSSLQMILDHLKAIKSVKNVCVHLLLGDLKKKYSVAPVAQKE